jgi:hypothetical protein
MIAADDQLGDALRAKALTWLGRVSKMKRKAVANKKMLVPMIQVLFKVVCEMPQTDEVITNIISNDVFKSIYKFHDLNSSRFKIFVLFS